MPQRPCEVYALRRRDLSLASRKARIENDLIATAESRHKPVLGHVKTPESRREVFLTDEVATALARLLEAQMATGRTTPESFVFVSPDGMPIRHSDLARNWWKPLLRKAAELAEKAARDAGDLDYRFPQDAGPYSLRHTHREPESGRRADGRDSHAGWSFERSNDALQPTNGSPQAGGRRSRRQVDGRTDGHCVGLRVALQGSADAGRPQTRDRYIVRVILGAPGQNRTGNLGLRSPLLYPV